jgi:UDP-N-acetylmuramyl tripeptide synthase
MAPAVGRPWRTRLAVSAGRVVSGASRLTRRGHGAVIGGRVALRVDPAALARLAAGRAVTIVSGTNGKTTTTRLVGAALAVDRAVATNRGGNMPAGMVEALASGADEVVLECDELYVPEVLAAVAPRVVVLLNVSRDQLDRITEIRRIAEVWRGALASPAGAGVTAVANADDPLVVWAVGDHRPVVWVAAGYRWTEDAALCPACGRVRPLRDDGTWTCGCGLDRPVPDWCLDGDAVVGPGGRVALALALPGRFNQANALMAVAVAAVRGVEPATAAAALAGVREVSGRYATVRVGGHEVQLLLAKNPASWTEVLTLLDGDDRELTLCLNARTADGKDTSWIWDVPFERLAGRRVVVSGDRRADLALRLEVAGVEPVVVEDPSVGIAELDGARPVTLAATYTAFHDLLDRWEVRW